MKNTHPDLFHTRARLADLDLARRLNLATVDPSFRSKKQFAELVELAKEAAGRLILRAMASEVAA